MEGYFDDGVNQLCQTCHHSCKTCSLIATNCTTCNSDKGRLGDDTSTNVTSTGLCPC